MSEKNLIVQNLCAWQSQEAPRKLVRNMRGCIKKVQGLCTIRAWLLWHNSGTRCGGGVASKNVSAQFLRSFSYKT